jgi:hypothetical protein
VSVGLERVAADEPTAVQARRDVQATDDRMLISALTGLGVGSIFHVRTSLVPPAGVAPAVTLAVKPSKTVNAPSSRVARREWALARSSLLPCRVTIAVRL